MLIDFNTTLFYSKPVIPITAPQAALIITTIYGYHLSQEKFKVYLLRYSLDCEL